MNMHAQIGGRWVHVASTFVMIDDRMETVPEWVAPITTLIEYQGTIPMRIRRIDYAAVRRLLVWRESDRARIRQMTNQYRRRKRGWRT